MLEKKADRSGKTIFAREIDGIDHLSCDTFGVGGDDESIVLHMNLGPVGLMCELSPDEAVSIAEILMREAANLAGRQ